MPRIHQERDEDHTRPGKSKQEDIVRYEAIQEGEEYLAAYHAVGDALNGGLDFIDVKLEPEYVESLGGDADGYSYCTRALDYLEEAKSRPIEIDLRGRIMEQLLEDLGG